MKTRQVHYYYQMFLSISTFYFQVISLKKFLHLFNRIDCQSDQKTRNLKHLPTKNLAVFDIFKPMNENDEWRLFGPISEISYSLTKMHGFFLGS